jgi:hypothetical protein
MSLVSEPFRLKHDPLKNGGGEVCHERIVAVRGQSSFVGFYQRYANMLCFLIKSACLKSKKQRQANRIL